MFYMCFMMFYYVNNVLWCLASHATIGARLRDRDNAAGIGDNSAEIGDNSAEIGDGTAGIVDIATNMIQC